MEQRLSAHRDGDEVGRLMRVGNGTTTVNFLRPLAVMRVDRLPPRGNTNGDPAERGQLCPIINGDIMRSFALCAGLVLASTAAYADKRGIYHPDDMQTARADIRADKRATALAKAKRATEAETAARRNFVRQ